MLRGGIYSVINIGGLAIGMAAAISHFNFRITEGAKIIPQ